MTPDTLAKANTEHSHQRALFAFINCASQFGFNVAWDWASGMGIEAAKSSRTNDCKPIPVLKRLHAIPNGGYRDKITAGKLKAEGVKTGVPDVFLPVPMFIGLVASRLSSQPPYANPATAKAYCGLYVELKRPKTVKAGVRKALIVDRTAGSTSAEQDDWIVYLREAGYAVSVCFDWRSAAKEIQRYIEGALIPS